MAEARRSSTLDLIYASYKTHQDLKSASWFSRLGRRLFGADTAPTFDSNIVQEEYIYRGISKVDNPFLFTVESNAKEVDSVCEFLTVILWKCYSSDMQRRLAFNNSVKRQVLNTVAYSGPTSKFLWVHLLTRYGSSLVKIKGIQWLAPGEGSMHGNAFISALVIMAAILQHEFTLLSNEDFRKGLPLAQAHIVHLVKTLKVFCYEGCLAHTDEKVLMPTTTMTTAETSTSDSSVSPAVLDVSYTRFVLTTLCRFLATLYNRWSRKAFCALSVWVLSDANFTFLRHDSRHWSPRAKLLLHLLPFTIPFSERLTLFREWIQSDKDTFQNRSAPIVVKIRRASLLDDGLSMLNSLPEEFLKRRIVVVYVSEAGTQESGIDLGGLLKDYITDACRLLFDPAFGLFRTNRSGFLYPNPIAPLIHNDYATLFEFAGKIVGKAMYESVVVAPLFLPMVLGHMRGHYDYMQMLQDLSDVSEELYKNLLYLQSCEDDAVLDELGLCFAVAHQDLGRQHEEELIEGGAQIPVSKANRLEYIQLVTKHHVVDRIAEQSKAFCRGFHQIISPSWLRVFNECELQLLVSGSIGGEWDVEDLRRHSRYGQGYRGADKAVRILWDVLEELDYEKRRQFLHFVTSSDRAPLGGFTNLDPVFTITRASLAQGCEKRLPMARTCFNELIWPCYTSKLAAKNKLLQAISSGAGFELT